MAAGDLFLFEENYVQVSQDQEEQEEKQDDVDVAQQENEDAVGHGEARAQAHHLSLENGQADDGGHGQNDQQPFQPSLFTLHIGLALRLSVHCLVPHTFGLYTMPQRPPWGRPHRFILKKNLGKKQGYSGKRPHRPRKTEPGPPKRGLRPRSGDSAGRPGRITWE